MAIVMSSITLLGWSCGNRAMALPHRPGHGLGPDVDRVRHPIPHRHVERRHRPVRLDHGGRRRRRHIRERGGGGELPQERGIGLDVDGAAGDPDADDGRPRRVGRPGGDGRRARGGRPTHRRHAVQPGVRRQRLGDLVEHVRPDIAVRVDAADDADLRDQRVADLLGLPLLRDHGVEAPLLDAHRIEPRLEHPQAGALGDEQQQSTPDHDHRRRARGEQPRVLDTGQQALEIGQGELEPSAPRRLFLFSGKEIDFDHAARLSARPTDSISSGAISSTETDSNTLSRTLSRCTGLASSTGTRNRLESASFKPGTRAPPPIVYTRPRPPADRDAVARNAAARSTPTAISSPRASTYCARSALCVIPWMTRSESSAESAFSRCKSSRTRRVPTDRSRVSTGTPSSRMFTLVTSCPMLTKPTTPCMASGWFSSNALWIANASTSMIAGSSPASPKRDVRLSTSSRLAAPSSTFIFKPSASWSRIWKSSSTV